MWRVNIAGGLTRGRGMCESQKSQSLLSMPAGADMTQAIQELNGEDISSINGSTTCRSNSPILQGLRRDRRRQRKKLLWQQPWYHGESTSHCVGCGLEFMPGRVAEAKYFTNHRHLALAIASSGGGIGSFAFPPFIQMLNECAIFRMSYAACGGSLIPAIIIDISGVHTFGVTYGIVLLGLAFGQLTGAPVAIPWYVLFLNAL
ncbi:Hypothetical predicted protein [Mytilus galloprovincialis]|uniref:Major facilitator superfamily (MFS) profile domain-containing protein n=1 Tax=Mytilus galloprovincialis TaxID=29158 RepID=A0A8B6GD73_MYTGA|nr:Hypothetical predicted protein [Mytilus galloprovincialis]